MELVSTKEARQRNPVKIPVENKAINSQQS